MRQNTVVKNDLYSKKYSERRQRVVQGMTVRKITIGGEKSQKNHH